MSVFDCESPAKKTTTDWSGTIIGLVLLPVLFFFIYLGKAEMGFTLTIVLGVAALAIKLHWDLKKHVWFWATIIFISALHVPLLFVVRWPETSVPTIAYSMPLGIVDFMLIMGAISVAERIFSRDPSSHVEDE